MSYPQLLPVGIDLVSEKSAKGKKKTRLDKFIKLQLEVEQDPNNFKKWTSLFDAFESHIQENVDKLDSMGDDFKSLVNKSYQEIVSRFPYLTEIWKAWLIIEFKLNGTESSIRILQKSVETFPYSVDLWVDYLSAQISQYTSSPDDESLRFIRYLYSQAIDLNGRHFTSHGLWDKIIEFEKSLNPKSIELLQVLLKVIKIPLYQYAQYYNQFVEINKDFPVQDIIDENKIKEYIIQFQKSSLDEFSLVEKHQIIDDFSYAIFRNTQDTVNEKWTFESSLSIQYFSLDNLKEMENEFTKWTTYLDHEIQKINQYQTSTDIVPSILESQFAGVVNLFERALVPNCFNSNLWLKYLAFLNILKVDDKFELMKNVYDKAVSSFIPLDDNIIRFSYAKFLLKHDKVDLASEYLFDLIKLFSGSTIYLKQQYIQSLTTMIDIWSQVVSHSKLVNLLEDIINEYFGREKSKRRNEGKTETDSTEAQDTFKLDSKYTNLLSKLLNDEGICAIILKYLSLLKTDNQVLKSRQFFNQFYAENALKKSIGFWKFFIDFEGLSQHNIDNLRSILHYIQMKTQLPKSVVDSMIDLCYDIIGANLSHTKRFDDILVKRDNDTSNSLLQNKSARYRLIANNYIVKQTEGHFNDQEGEFLKVARKHAGHPGIFTEATPEITNQIMNDGNWIKLTDTNLQIPPFPTFKNVEKASLGIKYPV